MAIVEEILINPKIIDNYGDIIKIKNAKIETWDAGHTPGSCMFVVEVDGKRIMYTGDFKLEPTLISHGARYDVGKVDLLIMENTYSSRDHPPRTQVEKQLLKEIKIKV